MEEETKKEKLIESNEEEEEYAEVERIIRKRKRDDTVQYFVKWKGYPSSQNSWVEEDDILDGQLIEDFETKPSPKKTPSKLKNTKEPKTPKESPRESKEKTKTPKGSTPKSIKKMSPQEEKEWDEKSKKEIERLKELFQEVDQEEIVIQKCIE